MSVCFTRSFNARAVRCRRVDRTAASASLQPAQPSCASHLVRSLVAIPVVRSVLACQRIEPHSTVQPSESRGSGHRCAGTEQLSAAAEYNEAEEATR